MISKTKKLFKLAYLVSHPIQYQSPLLRQITEHPDIDLKVFFLSDLSIRSFKNKEFNEEIKWDVPLLKGFSYEFLPCVGSNDSVSFFRPLNYGLKRHLKNGNFDALWVHGYNYQNNLRAILTAKKLGIKVLMRGDSTLISTYRSPLKLFFKDKFLKWLFPKCDGFLSVGSLNKSYYQYYKVPQEKIFDMPYAVDNHFFQQNVIKARSHKDHFKASLCLKKGRPIILYAGKLMTRKRPMDLLEAYIKLSKNGKNEPNPYLLFVGNGEERNRLEMRAKETGWRSIRFLGFQNQSKLPAYFDLCDVFVLPSSLEPWGLIINEVMNAEKPVIVSDQVGCAPDLVKDGENGFIFPAGDIQALAEALKNITNNPSLAKEMGRKSLEKINSFGYKENLICLRKALESLINHEENSICR